MLQENYAGTLHSKTLACSNKGHTGSTSLLTILLDSKLDWGEFETLPEELHLTNIAFEIFQINEQPLFDKNFNSILPTRLNDYDHKLLMLVGLDKIPSYHHAFDHLILLSKEPLIAPERGGDIFTCHNSPLTNTTLSKVGFDNEVDIHLIEELRFWINERI